MKPLPNPFKKPQPSIQLDQLIDDEDLVYNEKHQLISPQDPTLYHIRSLLLAQHCQIRSPSELDWFMDGLQWLAKQHYTTLDHLLDLERSAEAYFGIPLDVCQDHWAARVLLSWAARGSLLRRMRFKSSGRFKLRRLFCF